MNVTTIFGSSSVKAKLIAILLATLSPAALACYGPPAAANRDHASLVQEATAILLVEVRPGFDKSCQMHVLRTLKGDASSLLLVPCRIGGPAEFRTSFNGHDLSEHFWHDRVGSLGFDVDCSVRPPTFNVGRSYLILLGIAPDSKEFEPIDSMNDHWLQFVQKELIKKN
jgi:hypothetical protein